MSFRLLEGDWHRSVPIKIRLACGFGALFTFRCRVLSLRHALAPRSGCGRSSHFSRRASQNISVFSLAQRYRLYTGFSAPCARHVLLSVLCLFGVLHFCLHSSARSQPGLAPSRSVRPGRWMFASDQPRSQPTLGGFDLGILRRLPRLHFLTSLWLRVKLAFCIQINIWGSCVFLNGVPLCDGAQHLIVLQRILFPKPPSPTASPCFFPEVSGSAC